MATSARWQIRIWVFTLSQTNLSKMFFIISIVLNHVNKMATWTWMFWSFSFIWIEMCRTFDLEKRRRFDAPFLLPGFHYVCTQTRPQMSRKTSSQFPIPTTLNCLIRQLHARNIHKVILMSVCILPGAHNGQRSQCFISISSSYWYKLVVDVTIVSNDRRVY